MKIPVVATFLFLNSHLTATELKTIKFSLFSLSALTVPYVHVFGFGQSSSMFRCFQSLVPWYKHLACFSRRRSLSNFHAFVRLLTILFEAICRYTDHTHLFVHIPPLTLCLIKPWFMKNLRINGLELDQNIYADSWLMTGGQ